MLLAIESFVRLFEDLLFPKPSRDLESDCWESRADSCR